MNRQLIKIALLLFGSGMCALVYQTTWLREFRLIFGGSTAASAAVLAIFMGGLGVGSALLGKRSDRRSNPLAFYSELELGIAASAAITPILVLVVRQAYAGLGGTLVLGMGFGTILRLLGATLVLCVPTFLMGGTLPAAARAVETEGDVSRRKLAFLYGMNTLGAVTGAAVATFVLLESLGNRKTLWLACLINAVVALTARSISRSMPVFQRDEAASPLQAKREMAEAPLAASEVPSAGEAHHLASPEKLADPALAESDAVPALYVLIAAAVVGFAFLLMELVWYRMLGPLLGGSSFTFGLILAVALLGVGLGGAAYALFGENRSPSLNHFALTCALEAAFVAFPYALGDRIAVLAILLRPMGSMGFYGYVLGWSAVAALVVLPAAFIAGVQFPLLIALMGSGRRNVGRHVGLAYAWNTAGAIVGSLAGGFGLLPALSATGAWRAVVFIMSLLSVVGLALAYFKERRPLYKSFSAGAAVVVSLLFLFAAGPTAAWRHSQIGAGRANRFDMNRNTTKDWIHYQRRSVRWEVEGVESSVALKRSEGYAFVVNGKIDGHARGDAGTQVMSGLVGTVLHPAPKNALVIGLGTGSTSGWLAAMPGIERVDTIELEPAILHVANECRPVNANAMQNPKVHVMIGDGREVLLTSRRRYDLILSEPSNPYRAGIASLFTREFYRAAADRMAEGALFLQWVQAYEIDGQTVRTAYATLSSVFPVVETYQTTISDLLLVASMKPIAYDAATLRQRLSQEPVRSAMRQTWRAIDLEGFLGHYVANSDFARVVAQKEGSRVNTDDRNLIEFGLARNLGNMSSFDVRELHQIADARGESRPERSAGNIDWTSVEDQRNAFFADSEVRPLIRDYFTPDRRLRAEALASYVKRDFKSAFNLWGSQSGGPSNLTELSMVAEILADMGDERSELFIGRLRSFQPIEANAILGRLRWRQNRLAEATDALEASSVAYRNDPWPSVSLMERTLEVIAAVALHDRERKLARRLYEAVRRPFSVYLANDVRLQTGLKIARYVDGPGFSQLTLNAIAQFEPDIPWQGDFLQARAQCYERLGDARAAVARRDLNDFLSNEPVRFASGLQKSSAGADKTP